MSNSFKCFCRQRGLTTLIVSSIILFAITLVVLYASKSVLIEQKIFNNLLFSQEELLQQENSLNQAINKHKQHNKIDIVSSESVSDLKLPFVERYLVRSDSDANSSFSAWMASPPLLGLGAKNIPLFPLIVRKSIEINSDFQVINEQYKRTIWAGQSVELGVSPNTFTEITIENKKIKSSSANLGNHLDIIDNDRNLSLLSSNELFSRFFNEAPNWVKQWAIDQQRFYRGNQLQDIKTDKGFLWLGGGESEISLSSIQLGTPENPVIVIVDANQSKLITRGKITIYGVLYVLGDWQAQGELMLNGLMVIDGSILPGTSPEFINTIIKYTPGNIDFKSMTSHLRAVINGSFHHPSQ